MKVKPVDNLGFTPITFTIVIENKDELLDFYHRMNLSNSRIIAEAVENSIIPPPNYDKIKGDTLFEHLSSLVDHSIKE